VAADGSLAAPLTLSLQPKRLTPLASAFALCLCQLTRSHTGYEVKKITADNMKLCNRLVEISRASPNPAYNNAMSVGSAAASGEQGGRLGAGRW
jgi:hypothetical protein